MAVIHFNFLSRELRRKTNISIILPMDYIPEFATGKSSEFPGMKYQTLWLLHGGCGDESDFMDFSRILDYAERHKVAVVMPSGIDFYAEPYFSYVTKELPERLSRIFPFSTAREDNFIGGLSFGGDCAMKAIMEYPDRYAAGLMMSSAGTGHHGETPDLRFPIWELAERNLASGQKLPKMIFATGTGDRGLKYYDPIIKKLTDMGLPVTYRFVEGDGHSWKFWDNMLREAFEEHLPIRNAVIAPEE